MRRIVVAALVPLAGACAITEETAGGAGTAAQVEACEAAARSPVIPNSPDATGPVAEVEVDGRTATCTFDAAGNVAAVTFG